MTDGWVFLVNAPARVAYGDFARRPPIGLLYLSTVLREAGIYSRIFDFQSNEASWADLDEAIRDSPKCIVGFTVDSDNIYRVLRAKDRILTTHDNVIALLGGPHITNTRNSYASEVCFEIRGEGEFPIIEFARYYLNGRGCLEDIPSLSYVLDGKIHKNPISFGPYDNIDSIPIPDYTLLPSSEEYMLTITTSRGCLYQCRFCSEGREQHRFRPRSVAGVEKEMCMLAEANRGALPYISFMDDTFTSSAERVNEFCDMFDRCFPDKKNFGFYCEGRVNVLAKHPELTTRMKAAGL